MATRTRRPKVSFGRGKLAVGASLPYVAGARGPEAKQAAEYERVMGRPWSDPDPRRENYGAPTYPTPVRLGDPEWEDAYAKYDAAMAAWEQTPNAARYRVDWDAWVTRRAQFRYTGRGRLDAQVLEQARA